MSPGIPPEVWLVVRVVHLLAMALALGAGAATILLLRAEQVVAARIVTTKIELASFLVAILAGLGLVMANPAVFDPAQSGIWLHLKLALVMGALFAAVAKLFALFSAEAGQPTLGRARGLALLSTLFVAGAVALAVFRYTFRS